MGVVRQDTGRPDSLPAALDGSRHRCPITQAKKEGRIAGHSNKFFG
jgi:hypothetical protein